ncbi:MAG: FadR family transcriptional regulator [Pseudolabrys sp.]|nr:FadR family transcriptional regulator [Pseudolabrys sp.]
MSLRVKMSGKRAQRNLALLRPIEAPRGLTAELVNRLTNDIMSGKLPPGSQLPTEQEMIAATGVSRTVIREAVAALRADGLVVTRQGVGAFVAENVRRPFRVDFDERSSLGDVLNVMELRAGVEIESAGLAAERANPDQIRKIAERLAAVQSAISRGETAVDEDFAFHCEVADATGNPQFRRFLEYLGRFIIPRQTVWGPTTPVLGKTHLGLFQREHEQIFAAIRAHNVKQARATMQKHLQRSRERYQKIASKFGIK